MDIKVRALRLDTAIREKVPGVVCDVRVSQFTSNRGPTEPEREVLVVTVTLAGTEVTCLQRHQVHEVCHLEFRGENVSLQLIG